jgi:hypothetical protein
VVFYQHLILALEWLSTKHLAPLMLLFLNFRLLKMNLMDQVSPGSSSTRIQMILEL